jgi:glutamine synthetase
MEVLRNVAEEHGFACLLHEKPFAGVNGSGKHNNWSVIGPDGRNWLTPGDNPHENTEFLIMICALIKAIDTHAALLRASVTSAGNDHRLGAHEAPPAILSVFLGDQLFDVIDQIEQGSAKSSKQKEVIKIGVTSLPQLPKDITDRNRTSPFAFTGNKFEFRAIGSSQNCASSNMVLNTIVADALDEICTELESEISSGKKFNDSLQSILQGIVQKHKRVLFNGDSYTQEWKDEAARRGLPNLISTPEALKALIAPETITLFEKHGILSKRELESRYLIYKNAYETTITFEANCSNTIARTMIIPVAVKYQNELVTSIRAVEETLGKGNMSESKKLFKEISGHIEAALKTSRKVETCLETGNTQKIIAAMAELRTAVDTLEGLLPRNQWPLPSYAEMMFIM